jgi:hypothetical protein
MRRCALLSGGSLLLEQPDDALDILDAVAVGYEHRVVAFDHHQLFQSQAHYKVVFAA